jgi:hypothetical protein
LKRYKKSYPGKRDTGDTDIDLLSISQAEPLFPSFIAGGKTLLAVKSKVDNLKVAPIEKVQEWLQRNDDELGDKPVQSPESQQQKLGTITVTADVHRGVDDETDLVSVSQQRFYLAPRKADVATLLSPSDGLCTYGDVKCTSNAKRVFTSRDVKENSTKLGEKFSKARSDEGDPYKFISSQEIKTVPKNKMKEKGKIAVKKRKIKNFKMNGPSLQDNKKGTAENNTLSCNSPVSDFTFICPVEINNTFDNLVANTQKLEPEKRVTNKVHTEDDNSDDMRLFRTPLEVPTICQKNDGSTTESMSDIDFSSGSDDEWGAANQVNLQSVQVSGRRTRSSNILPGNIPAKEFDMKSNFKQKTRSKSSGICSRRSANLEDPVKKTPLSPTKKLNLYTNIQGFNNDNMKQGPAVCKDTNNKSENDFVTCSSTDKVHSGKENITCPVNEKFGDEDRIHFNQAMNMTVCSRSPGWSRISQSKKDFERSIKPVLKALNVSGGDVCIPKKHVTFVSKIPKKPDIMNEAMSPVPTIDDSSSDVGIPVVGFNSPSPKTLNRVEMMSRIIMNLESEMAPRSSTGNTEVCTETKLLQAEKDMTLKKCASFGFDAFSEPTSALDSQKSCQRKEVVSVVLSSLEDKDQLEHKCNESNEQFMSHITKLGGDGESAQECHNINDNIMKNPQADMTQKVLMAQDCNSSMAYEKVIENTETNLMINQSITPTTEDCIQSNSCVQPIPESGDNGSSNRFVSDEALQNGNINSEQFIAFQKKGECNSVVPLLPVSSNQDMQNLILSKKCNQEKLAVAPSDVINSRKDLQKSLPCSTKEPLTDIQPKITDTEPMEITTKNFHQTQIHSSCNSSVTLDSTYLNKIHIPFIKCGRLKSLRKITKFVLLGPLAPRRKTMSSETFPECSSNDSLGLYFGVSGRSPLGISYETGTQTSPRLLHPHHRSNITDAKLQTTPQVNSQSFQFTTPTDTIHYTQRSEHFVPDSCDNMYTFPDSIPLPHHSVLWQTPVASKAQSQTKDSLISPIYQISEPLHTDKNPVKDLSVQDDVDTNKTAVLRNQCGYSRPTGDYTDNEIPSSQFSTATTIKIQHIRTSDNGGQSLSKSPELSSNSAVHSHHSTSILQKLNNENAVDSFQDQCDTPDSQKVVYEIQYDNANDERNAKTHQQNKMTESGKVSFAEEVTEELNFKPRKCNKNDCGNISTEKSNKMSKVSRQLKFSPTFIPKLSDPLLDVSKEDGEKDTQKLHKKSYKRIRMATNSLDSGTESNDVSDSEIRKIKKSCHTSLKKASDEDKNKEVFLNQEAVNDEAAETSPQVVDLLTPPEEAHADLTPDADDKTSIEEKWLQESVPNSEELMARVMANIEADLAETRKRKMKEGIDSDEKRGKESPTLFTPSLVGADSEELGSKVTCELVISQSGEPEKRPAKESFVGIMTVGTDSESLCTQQRNKIQVSIGSILKLFRFT